jgi:hypothetical protein
MYIVRNVKFICASFKNRWESESLASFSALFCSECIWNLYFLEMDVYCVYPAMSKSPKQLPNCLKRAKTSVVLVVFDGVLCDTCSNIVTVSYRCSTWIRYQKNYILVSDLIYNKNWSSPCNLVQIEPISAKFITYIVLNWDLIHF